MADFREYDGVDFTADFIIHYGVGHEDGGHSGRYPWGSGKKVKYQHKLENIQDAKSRKKVSRYYTKRLNKLEGERVKDSYKYFRIDNISERKQKRILERSRKRHEELMDTIKELSRNGYGINSKAYNKDMTKGKRIAEALLTGRYRSKAWDDEMVVWRIKVKENYENDKKNDNVELARTFGGTNDVREVKEAILESKSRIK